MAEEDQDQRTEHATSKRLSEAREQGKLPVSREVSTWVMFIAILAVIGWMGPPMARDLLAVLRPFLESPHALSLNEQGLQAVMLNTVLNVGLAIGAIFLVLAGAAIFGVMAQTGFFVSLELIKPDFSRLSPANGLRRLISLHGGVETLKSFGKLIILGGAAYMTLAPLIHSLPGLTGQSMMTTLDYLHQQAVHLIIVLLMLFTVIAVSDWLFQHYYYLKNLRMTKEEVKDEHRQQEGDPTVKARLRQIRLEKARKRMMAQVPKADVIITNPTHYAVALQYDGKKMSAPVVLAKGVDRVAERIREVADENKIPLVSNPPLARALYDTVEIDREIPAQHYRAVAEIISYIYKLKNRRG